MAKSQNRSTRETRKPKKAAAPKPNASNPSLKGTVVPARPEAKS